MLAQYCRVRGFGDAHIWPSVFMLRGPLRAHPSERMLFALYGSNWRCGGQQILVRCLLQAIQGNHLDRVLPRDTIEAVASSATNGLQWTLVVAFRNFVLYR